MLLEDYLFVLAPISRDDFRSAFLGGEGGVHYITAAQEAVCEGYFV